MFIVGHALVWHDQLPDWVFHDDKGNLLGRDALLARMRDHIHTVVGRYKGKIHSWDVVNEPIDEDGTMRQSLWYKIIGEDYVAKAFQFAHEADPQAQLVYNDYSIENPSQAQRRGRSHCKAQGRRRSHNHPSACRAIIGSNGRASINWTQPSPISEKWA